MKPENILQADLLDIIFINRNKDYGAYALRKNYDARLVKSFAITVLFSISLALAYYINTNFFNNNDIRLLIPVTDVKLEPAADQPKKKEEIKQVKKEIRQAVKAYTPLKIVPDNQVDKNVPEIQELDNKLIGSVDKSSEDFAEGQLALVPSDGNKDGKEVVAEKPEIIEPTAPLVKAEIMPEFPGGMEAFKKFMLRQLRQPELNEGEKVIVRVQFVVDADGSIKQVNVLQSGGKLDGEVIRVVGKMPKWKPGVQNGRFVAVYFTLPVTFLGPEI